jgi:CTP synthase
MIRLTSKWIQTVYNHNVGVTERYRHRFHVNRSLANESQIVGLCNGRPAIMLFSNTAAAADESKWRALGVQFHPEYQSRNNKPHPIFIEFLKRIMP